MLNGNVISLVSPQHPSNSGLHRCPHWGLVLLQETFPGKSQRNSTTQVKKNILIFFKKNRRTGRRSAPSSTSTPPTCRAYRSSTLKSLKRSSPRRSWTWATKTRIRSAGGRGGSSWWQSTGEGWWGRRQSENGLVHNISVGSVSHKNNSYFT